jgi:dolichol-phosphate mannosyltransferase
MDDVTILIPCIEEDKNLQFLLPRIKKNLHKYKYKIIVIGSKFKKDNAEAICKKYSVNFIRRKKNNNYGEAIKTGFKILNSKKVIVMDADGSHEPSFITKMLKSSRFYDLVIASRYVKRGGSQNNFFLIFLSKLLNICYSVVLNISIKDISNSFRCYDVKIIKNLKLYCNHFDIVEEILFKIMKKHRLVKIIEIPFVFKKRKYEKSKRNLFLAIYYLVTLIKIKLFL